MRRGRTLHNTELVSGSVWDGHSADDNLSWLDSFSSRTRAHSDQCMTPSPVLGSVALERKRGGVCSALCLLYNGLFIFLNFNDLTPIWRILLPLLSLCSGIFFPPG